MTAAAYDVDVDVRHALGLAYINTWSPDVQALLFAPEGYGTAHTLDEALDTVGDALPDFLLPLCVVDERSLACVAMQDEGPFRAGDVLRFFASDVPRKFQYALLDIHPLLYLSSLQDELAARQAGLDRVLNQIGPAYKHSHLDIEKRPRDYVVRPVRIACQNVIVGLAAIAQDPSFDGLAVPAWQTCEVPHLATHEANRALAALTLCDAFQNGGTMEVRFDRRASISLDGRAIEFDGHPEKKVPASLRRFGRTMGVGLGVEDPRAITPSEARELFLAITPMPDGLGERVRGAITHGGLSPERICFLLLSQVWREIELDYLLATTSRISMILSGGAPWTDRLARQAESEICRGSVMAGMLFRRLNLTDAAAVEGESGVRVVEDRTKGITWSIQPEPAAITFDGLDPTEPVPWTQGVTGVRTLTVFPRTAATPAALATMQAAGVPGPRALLLPADVVGPINSDFTVLRCPDRLADIDKNVEERLLKSRISRG
jgi:hypothetical protein